MVFRIFKCVVVISVALIYSGTTHADYIVNQASGTKWNYKKIYLSTAFHNGNNIGCPDLVNQTGDPGYDPNEERLSQRYAGQASWGDTIGGNLHYNNSYRNLRTRGYKIRLGYGSVANKIANSNSWNADLHIPIHSNAIDPNPPPCNTNDNSKHGTWVLYHSNNGKKLSDLIMREYKSLSPGTNDRVCTARQCIGINCLAELCQTSAVAAYFEREFHTWNKGIEFLSQSEANNSAWRLGRAIDSYLGYPRG